VGTAIAERINGNAGNDTIDGNGGNDQIFGNTGDDRIIWNSGDGSDVINGGEGTDTLEFNCSNQGDRLVVQPAFDSIQQDAFLQVGRTRPVFVDLQVRSIEQLNINCLQGNDGVLIRFTGGLVNLIRVSGGAGNDTIDGDFRGSEATAILRLAGNSGNDTLKGGINNDTLLGGIGNDTLAGNNGDDILVGGTGGDLLTGGAGVDTFQLALGDSLLGNFDRISDLQIGTDVINGSTAIAANTISNLGAVASLDEGAIADLLSADNFGANRGATFRVGDRTFLALNNDTAGFSASTDAIVEITGFSGNLNNLQVV
jgi:Ca2+-binding RTX toxin-like protein